MHNVVSVDRRKLPCASQDTNTLNKENYSTKLHKRSYRHGHSKVTMRSCLSQGQERFARLARDTDALG